MNYNINRINQDLDKKIQTIEKGKNSIEVLNNRVSEISKLETNVINTFYIIIIIIIIICLITLNSIKFIY